MSRVNHEDSWGIRKHFNDDEIVVLRFVAMMQRCCSPAEQEAFTAFMAQLTKINTVSLRPDTLERCELYLRIYDFEE